MFYLRSGGETGQAGGIMQSYPIGDQAGEQEIKRHTGGHNRSNSARQMSVNQKRHTIIWQELTIDCIHIEEATATSSIHLWTAVLKTHSDGQSIFVFWNWGCEEVRGWRKVKMNTMQDIFRQRKCENSLFKRVKVLRQQPKRPVNHKVA